MARFKIKRVRLSFPDVFNAKEFTPGDDKPRFNATFLVEPGSANDKLINEHIDAALKEAFGAKAAAMKKSFEGNVNKYCYQDGDTKEYDGYAGKMFLACHNKTRPTLRDIDGRTPITAESGRLYGGCYVDGIVEIYVQTTGYPGVRASFSGIQFVADGDAFGGGAPARDEDFEDLTLGDDAADDLI